MGANGALKLAFKYPELFRSVVAYAGSYKRLPLDGYFPEFAPEQQAWIAKLSQWYSADDDVFELAHKNSARLGDLRIRFVAGTKGYCAGRCGGSPPMAYARGIPHEYEILLGGWSRRPCLLSAFRPLWLPIPFRQALKCKNKQLR